MKDRGLCRITVSRKGESWLETGHPWVYDTEVLSESGSFKDGDIVDVISLKEKYIGTGFINRHSKIRVRIFSRNANDMPTESFWARRVSHALALRRTVMGSQFSCCRLIFGEADLFPGLTVDRFGEVLVAQVMSLGMEMIKGTIFSLLVSQLRAMGENITGVYERNDIKLRELEGMTQGKGWFEGEGFGSLEKNETEICENGIRYLVDFENGQKTGFFLDQKFNRQAVADMAAGKRVLDCFTHTGSFALNAAKGGASFVNAVDISQDALQMAQRNAQLSGLSDRMTFTQANVFDLLTSMTGNEGYDFIILDPPAFTKSKSTVGTATKGYKDINMRAMRLLPRGGYLATCSCSHFMTAELFENMLRSAAKDAGVMLRQLRASQQAPDHPILWNVPETDYLKFYIFQVV